MLHEVAGSVCWKFVPEVMQSETGFGLKGKHPFIGVPGLD